MENVKKGMVIAFALIYLLFPLDLCPGSPVDDLIVILISLLANVHRR